MKKEHCRYDLPSPALQNWLKSCPERARSRFDSRDSKVNHQLAFSPGEEFCPHSSTCSHVATVSCTHRNDLSIWLCPSRNMDWLHILHELSTSSLAQEEVSFFLFFKCCSAYFSGQTYWVKSLKELKTHEAEP